MKKIMILVAAVLMAVGIHISANAYILDEYFGVNMSVDANGQFNMPWDPVRGYGIHENWRTDGNQHAPDPGPSYGVSELFDSEALYCDYDVANSQLVYSIITSMPSTGCHVSWWGSYLFRAGDIRFNTLGGTYMVSTFTGNYASYNYTAGRLYMNAPMGYYDGYRGFGERGNPILRNNSIIENYRSTTTSDFYFNYVNTGLMENGYTTYLIEGRINFADLGGFNNIRQGLSMNFDMSCNNDQSTLSLPPTAVPEPATLTLMGLGIAGIITATRRKLRK